VVLDCQTAAHLRKDYTKDSGIVSKKDTNNIYAAWIENIAECASEHYSVKASEVARDFEDQMTTIMRHTERILDKWTPAYGFVGACLLDLAINRAHHCILMSFTVCKRLGVPHFTTRQ